MRNLSILIIVVMSVSCSNRSQEVSQPTLDYEPNNSETVALYNTDTQLEFEAWLKLAVGGFDVIGRTNLPEGTKLGASVIRRGVTVAQNFDIYVISGSFKGGFGFSLGPDDVVQVACYDNRFWQDSTIYSQLEFMVSPDWEPLMEDRMIKFIVSRDHQDENLTDRLIIRPPLNHTPITKLIGEIIDVSNVDIKRYDCNIELSSKVSDLQVSKEIRYWLYKVITEKPAAKAISVKCYLGDLFIMRGVYAPYGDWSKASNGFPKSKFEVRIIK